MKYQSKSIKTVLNNHMSEIYALCQNKAQFVTLKDRVNAILDSAELSNNVSVPEAKQILKNCSNNYNHYLSTLMTYMTGIKVS